MGISRAVVDFLPDNPFLDELPEDATRRKHVKSYVDDRTDFKAPVDPANLPTPAVLRLTALVAKGFAEPDWFHLAGDGSNYAPAIQKAHDELAGSYAGIKEGVVRGGRLQLGRQRYYLDGALDFTTFGFAMVGQGAGNMVNQTPANPAPTTLICVQNVQEVLRARGINTRLEEFYITSEGDRASAGFNIGKAGIRIEADDTPSGRADRCVIRRVRVDRQPGDSLLLVGPVTGTEIWSPELMLSKGFGIRMDDGSFAGLTRANPHYPGLIDVLFPRVGFHGGNAIGISNPGVTTQFGMGVRITVHQLDCYANASDAAVRYSHDEIWAFAENTEFRRCGIGGASWTVETGFVQENHGGAYIAGRDNAIINSRFIATNQPITWGYRASQPSTGLEVKRNRNVQTSMTVTDFVKIEAGCVGLDGSYDRTEGFTNFATPANRDNVKVRSPTGEAIHGARHRAGSYTSSREIILADDAVATLDFSIVGQAAGILTLVATNNTAGGGDFHFRVGTSPEVTKWGGAASTVVGPSSGSGALTGTTGADGSLIVSAHTDGKIYIENRRGFAVTLNAHIRALTSTARLKGDQ